MWACTFGLLYVLWYLEFTPKPILTRRTLACRSVWSLWSDLPQWSIWATRTSRRVQSGLIEAPSNMTSTYNSKIFLSLESGSWPLFLVVALSGANWDGHHQFSPPLDDPISNALTGATASAQRWANARAAKLIIEMCIHCHPFIHVLETEVMTWWWPNFRPNDSLKSHMNISI